MGLRESILKSNNNATNIIAYVILAVFSTFLIIILLNALTLYNSDTKDIERIKFAEKWLDLFKDGFLLLGGALTTLIGYYFGNKGSEAALKTAENYTKEAEKLINELDKAAPTFNEEENDDQENRIISF